MCLRRVVAALLLSLSIILCAVAVRPIPASAAPALSLEGSGTQTDPWVIRSANDLINFSHAAGSNGGAFAGTYTELASDVDLSGVEEWTPMRGYFAGTFDGKGHTVSGMTIKKRKDMSGLFGGIAASGTVKNVNVSGSISVDDQNVGGIVGLNQGGTVSGCTSAVDIVAGDVQTGGVVGQNQGTVIACAYTGTLSGNQSYVGGIVGMNASGSIQACINTGSVSGSYAGGIAGSGRGTIKDCCNTGTVTGSKTGKIAGLKQFFTIQNCYYLSTFSSNPYKGEARRTQAQFASGQVAYELNNGVTNGTQTFYQTCGEGLPAFAGKTVYKVRHFACPGDTAGADAYSNENADTRGEHAFTAEVADPAYLKTAATCTDKAVYFRSCATCGLASGTETFDAGEVDPTNHTGAVEWTVQTETEHESVWSCCGKVDAARAPHAWSEGVCAECGYVCKHHAEIAFSHTASEHTGICSVCGKAIVGPTAHIWKDDACTVCGFKRASAGTEDRQGKQDGGSSKGSKNMKGERAAELPRTGDDSAALIALAAMTGTLAVAGGVLAMNRRR